MYFVVGIYKERGFALNPVSNIGLIQTERENQSVPPPLCSESPSPFTKDKRPGRLEENKDKRDDCLSSQGDNTFMCSLNKWRIYTVAQWPFSLVGALFLP